MKHKKVLASILALASLSTLTPLTAFAAESTVIDQTTENKTGITEVSYDVAAAYTVTIPAAVTLGDTEKTAEISAENVLLEKGKTVKVTLSEASNTKTEGATTFHAKCGDSTATYDITVGGTDVALGGTIATFETKAEQQKVELKFSAPTGATFAGKHTENLTFTIAVEDAVAAVTLEPETFLTNQGLSTYTGDNVKITPTDPDRSGGSGFYLSFYNSSPKNIATIEALNGAKIDKIEITRGWYDISTLVAEKGDISITGDVATISNINDTSVVIGSTNRLNVKQVKVYFQ